MADERELTLGLLSRDEPPPDCQREYRSQGNRLISKLELDKEFLVDEPEE